MPATDYDQQTYPEFSGGAPSSTPDAGTDYNQQNYSEFLDQSTASPPPSPTPETDRALANTPLFQSREAMRPTVMLPDWATRPLRATGAMLKGFVPTSMESARSMLTTMGGPSAAGMTAWLNEAVKSAAQARMQMQQVQQAPPFSQQWWNAAVPLTTQAGMLLSGIRTPVGIPRGVRVTPSVEAPVIEPAATVPEEPLPAEVEPKPTGEPEDATRIESTRPVPELEVRPPVGEEAPLRREPERAAGAQEEPVPAGQPVAAPAPEVPDEPGAALKEAPPPAEAPPALVVPSPEPEQHVSSIANKYRDEKIARGEIGPVAPGEGFSSVELSRMGQQMGPEERAQRISDVMQDQGGDIVKNGQAVRAEEARLQARSNELSKAAEAKPNDVEARLAADNALNDLTDFHKGPVAKIKTVFHGLGMGLQGELPVDLSTYNGLREAWFKDTGALPPKSVEGTLRKVAERVSGSMADEAGAMKNLGEAIGREAPGIRLTPERVRENILERLRRQTPCG